MLNTACLFIRDLRVMIIYSTTTKSAIAITFNFYSPIHFIWGFITAYYTFNFSFLIHIIRGFYWLQLHETFGPIVINISRVINDIMALAFTYLLVFVAFSFGMTYITDENTLALQNYTWSPLNLTIKPSGKVPMGF